MDAFSAGFSIGVVVGAAVMYAIHLFIVRTLENQLFEERAKGIAEGLDVASNQKSVKKSNSKKKFNSKKKPK